MNANSKEMQRAREELRYRNMASVFIKIAILTADDIWGVTQEDTERFIRGFEECVQGYGEIGIQKIDEELADRGIEVEITERKYNGRTKD